MGVPKQSLGTRGCRVAVSNPLIAFSPATGYGDG